jgi:hypothetical protein
MADETLSLRVEFGEIEKFKSDLDAARSAVLSLGESAATAGSDFNTLIGSLSETNSALAALAQPRAVEIDANPIKEAAKASDEAGAASKRMGDSAKKASADARSEFEKFADSVKKVAESIGQLPPVLQGVLGAFAGAGLFQAFSKTIASVSGTVKEAIGDFEEAQQAASQFAIALGSLGKFSTDAFESFNKFAMTIQETTTFSDEAVKSAGALIAQVGRVSGAKLQEATEAAIQLSSVLGRDLNSAALILAKAAQGNTAQLARFGIVLDETIPKGQKFAALLKLINAQFGGTAQLQAGTMAGQVTQLKNQWKEFLESIASTATIFLPTIAKMKEHLQAFNEFLESQGFKVKPVQDFGDAVENVTQKLDALELAQRDIKFGAKTAARLDLVVSPGELLQRKKEVDQAFATIKSSVEFAVNKGSLEQARSAIAGLAALIADATKRGRVEAVKELEKIRAEAQKALEIQIVLRSNQAVQDARDLFAFIESHRPGVFPEFDPTAIQKEMAELASGTIKIPVEPSIDDKALEEVKKAAGAVTVHAGKLDENSFRGMATIAAKIADDAFQEAQDIQRQVLAREAQLQALRGQAGPEQEGVGISAEDQRRVEQLERELDDLGKRFKVLQTQAQAFAPALDTITKQRTLVLNDAAFKAKLEESQKFLKQLQAEVPEFKLEIDATSAESTLPKVVSIVEQLQQFSKEPLALRLDLGNLVADAEDAKPAIEALDAAVTRLLSQHDADALVEARKVLEDFVRDPKIQAAFDVPTVAVRTRVTEILKTLDTELARLGPELKARQLTLEFQAEFDKNDVAAMRKTRDELVALVSVHPELTPTINLTEWENGILQAQSDLSPLKDERALEARLHFAVDTGNLDLAKQTLGDIKAFQDAHPEFKFAINFEGLQDSLLEIQSIQDEFNASMRAVDEATQVVTTAFVSGWDAALQSVKKMVADFVADTIKKLARIAFFSFFKKAVLPFPTGFLPFKPGFRPPAEPEPAPPSPGKAGAPRVAPTPSVEFRPAAPVRLAVPAPVIDPVRIPAAVVDVVQAPAVRIEVPAPLVKEIQASSPAPVVEVAPADPVKVKVPQPEVTAERPEPVDVPAPKIKFAPPVPVTVETPAPEVTVKPATPARAAQAAPTPRARPAAVPRAAAPVRLAPLKIPAPIVPKIEVPEFPAMTLSLSPVDLRQFLPRPEPVKLPSAADLRRLVPRAPSQQPGVSLANLRRIIPRPEPVVTPLQELPTVSFARLETSRAVATSAATERRTIDRQEPESILKRKAGPDVQVTFQGAFDGESVRRQFQSGSINRELVRMSRRGRL